METLTDQQQLQQKTREVLLTSGTWGVFRQLENVHKWGAIQCRE